MNEALEVSAVIPKDVEAARGCVGGVGSFSDPRKSQGSDVDIERALVMGNRDLKPFF